MVASNAAANKFSHIFWELREYCQWKVMSLLHCYTVCLIFKLIILTLFEFLLICEAGAKLINSSDCFFLSKRMITLTTLSFFLYGHGLTSELTGDRRVCSRGTKWVTPRLRGCYTCTEITQVQAAGSALA